MDTIELLRGVEVFRGLSEDELGRIAGICREARYEKGDLITAQGQAGSEMFIMASGMVEVTVDDSAGGGPAQRRVVNLGAGQIVGEMALVDGGPRSATVRCVADSAVSVIERGAFERLCQTDHHIGMIVYRNLAADLSFKLRHHHLSGH